MKKWILTLFLVGFIGVQISGATSNMTSRVDKVIYESDFLMKHILIHMQWGLEFYYEKNFEKALAQYQMVLELAPNFALAHKRIGSIMYQMEDKEDALKSWDKAIVLNPDDETLTQFLFDYREKIKAVEMEKKKIEAEIKAMEMKALEMMKEKGSIANENVVSANEKVVTKNEQPAK